MNDLEANAHGIPALGPNDLVTLNAGQPDARGNAAIISAGTGLGEAGIYFDGRELHPFACEGGHTDFGPRDPLEAEMLLHLKEKFAQGSAGHVSYERIVSGPGLRNIYEFLRDTGRGKETPEVTAAMQAGDPAAAITHAALAGSCPLCVQTLDMFVSLYGAEAGNLALKMMATRGRVRGGRDCAANHQQAEGAAVSRIVLRQRPASTAVGTDSGSRDYERSNGASRRRTLCRSTGRIAGAVERLAVSRNKPCCTVSLPNHNTPRPAHFDFSCNE